MKRTAVCLAFCFLTASAAVGQTSNIDVPAANGTVALSVRIVAGSGERVARAADTRAAEPDGVMVLPIPESGYVLRTEHFKESPDVTSMIPAGQPSAPLMPADSVCTSRWMVGSHEHRLVSTISKNENGVDWSRRHAEGFQIISSIYAPSGISAAPEQNDSDNSSSKDQARTRWTDVTGIQHEVSTRQRENEQRDAWLARHREAVQAFAVVLPPKA